MTLKFSTTKQVTAVFALCILIASLIGLALIFERVQSFRQITESHDGLRLFTRLYAVEDALLEELLAAIDNTPNLEERAGRARNRFERIWSQLHSHLSDGGLPTNVNPRVNSWLQKVQNFRSRLNDTDGGRLLAEFQATAGELRKVNAILINHASGLPVQSGMQTLLQLLDLKTRLRLGLVLIGQNQTLDPVPVGWIRNHMSQTRQLFNVLTNSQNLNLSLTTGAQAELEVLSKSQAWASLDVILQQYESNRTAPNLNTFWPLIDHIDSAFVDMIGNESNLWERSSSQLVSDKFGGIILLVASLIFLCGTCFMTYRIMLRQLTEHLTTTVEGIRSCLNGIKNVKQEIENGTHQLMEGTFQAAAALEKTSSTMTQMSSMVSQTAHKAQEAEQQGEAVAGKADEGTKASKATVESMESIFYSTARVQKASESIKSVTEGEMDQITEIINEIASKTDMIHDIVIKTQLLSFNASIEAARAGQHGKGFAVVAQEVGNLAKTSGKAADEIENLIHDSLKKVDSIIKNTKDRVEEAENQVNDTKDKVNAGKQASNTSTNLMYEIQKGAAAILKSIQTVTEANLEQERGIQQISQAINNIDRTTQDTKMQSEATVAMVKKLDEYCAELDRTIQNFSGTLKKDHGVSRHILTTGPVEIEDGGGSGDDDNLDESLIRELAERAKRVAQGEGTGPEEELTKKAS